MSLVSACRSPAVALAERPSHAPLVVEIQRKVPDARGLRSRRSSAFGVVDGLELSGSHAFRLTNGCQRTKILVIIGLEPCGERRSIRTDSADGRRRAPDAPWVALHTGGGPWRPCSRSRQPRGIVAKAAAFGFVLANAWIETLDAQPISPPPGLVSWWPGDRGAKDIIDDNDGLLKVVRHLDVA